MRFEKDFEDLIKTFNKFGVEYCIVGAIAVSYLAKPRYTTDIDFLVKGSRNNSKKTVEAIADFMGITLEYLYKQYELDKNYFAQYQPAYFQIGQDPVKVHITNSIDAINTELAINNKIKGTYGNETAFYINKEHLIQNKEAVGRSKDIIDVKALKKKKDKNSGFSR